jgi:hypothetical protein
MTETNLSLPPGYTSAVPFDRNRHAGLGLRGDRTMAWCAQLNSIPLVASEVGRAALDYPVAFVRDERTGEFLLLAILGLRAGGNLFVDRQGRWREHTYVPAFVRRYPFLSAPVRPVPGAESQQLICVQEDQLVPSPEPFFDVKGEPTAAWAPIQQLIEGTDGARRRSGAFTQRIKDFGLLVPFDALAMAPGGAQWRLQGMHRIDEEKLAALGPREIKLLQQKGEMRVIYGHLLSLENFAKLMQMTSQRVAAAAAPATVAGSL